MTRDATVVFFVALVIRLLHVWQLGETPYFSVLMGDSRGYDVWARAIAAGDWMGRDVFYQAPLYPYFLGAIYSVLGRDLLGVRIIQAVLGSLACVALGVAGSRLLSRRAGLVAGLMLALYPPAIFFDGLIQKSVLDALFICLALALVAWLTPGAAPGTRHAAPQGTRSTAIAATFGVGWVLLGMVMGALSLTRENALGLVAVVLIWAFTQRRRRPRAVLHPAGLLVAGLALVLLPVAARNYAVGGGFYLTTSQFGSNLFIGNNPLADGSYMSLKAGRGSPEFERLDATALAEQASGRPLTPGEVSGYWTGRTLDFIRSQPLDWLRLLGRKAWLLVSATETIDTESQESHAEYSLALSLLSRVWHFGVLLPLAVIGARALWPERRRLWILYAMTVTYAASVVLFYVVARYRYPIVPFVMLFAAAGLIWLAERVRGVPRRAVVGPVGAAVAAAIIANWPLTTAEARRAITANSLGTALQDEGRIGEAIAQYRRALELDPKYTPALNNLGTALRASGRLDEAAAVLGQAIEQQADAARAHYNLGNVLMAQGRPREAVAAFRAALGINPRSVDTHNNLGMALEAAGDLDAAVSAFRQAVALDDRSAVAVGNLGRALATKGEVGEAATALQRSIDLDPANPATRYDLGSLLLETGRAERAAEVLRLALALKPDDAKAHNNLGIALAMQGRIAEAVNHWREALRLEPGFKDAQVNLEKAGRR